MNVSYEITATLRAEMSSHPPVVLIYDARGNGGGRTCPTITGDHQNRITDYTALVVKYEE
jgi:DNA (cytosine-5)-methyltransferase 1